MHQELSGLRSSLFMPRGRQILTRRNRTFPHAVKVWICLSNPEASYDEYVECCRLGECLASLATEAGTKLTSG